MAEEQGRRFKTGYLAPNINYGAIGRAAGEAFASPIAGAIVERAKKQEARLGAFKPDEAFMAAVPGQLNGKYKPGVQMALDVWQETATNFKANPNATNQLALTQARNQYSGHLEDAKFGSKHMLDQANQINSNQELLEQGLRDFNLNLLDEYAVAPTYKRQGNIVTVLNSDGGYDPYFDSSASASNAENLFMIQGSTEASYKYTANKMGDTMWADSFDQHAANNYYHNTEVIGEKIVAVSRNEDKFNEDFVDKYNSFAKTNKTVWNAVATEAYASTVIPNRDIVESDLENINTLYHPEYFEHVNSDNVSITKVTGFDDDGNPTYAVSEDELRDIAKDKGLDEDDLLKFREAQSLHVKSTKDRMYAYLPKVNPGSIDAARREAGGADGSLAGRIFPDYDPTTNRPAPDTTSDVEGIYGRTIDVTNDEGEVVGQQPDPQDTGRYFSINNSNRIADVTIDAAKLHIEKVIMNEGGEIVGYKVDKNLELLQEMMNASGGDPSEMQQAIMDALGGGSQIIQGGELFTKISDGLAQSQKTRTGPTYEQIIRTGRNELIGGATTTGDPVATGQGGAGGATGDPNSTQAMMDDVNVAIGNATNTTTTDPVTDPVTAPAAATDDVNTDDAPVDATDDTSAVDPELDVRTAVQSQDPEMSDTLATAASAVVGGGLGTVPEDIDESQGVAAEEDQAQGDVVEEPLVDLSNEVRDNAENPLTDEVIAEILTTTAGADSVATPVNTDVTAIIDSAADEPREMLDSMVIGTTEQIVNTVLSPELVAGIPAALEAIGDLDPVVEGGAEMINIDDGFARNPLAYVVKFTGVDETDLTQQEVIKRFFNSAVEGYSDDKTLAEVATQNAWCAAFAYTILKSVDDSDIDETFTDSEYQRVRALQYANYGSDVSFEEAKAGDIVVINKAGGGKFTEEITSETTGKSHVAFYLGEDPDNKDNVLILGGNQSRQGSGTGTVVNIKSYPKDEIGALRRMDNMEELTADQVKAVTDQFIPNMAMGGMVPEVEEKPKKEKKRGFFTRLFGGSKEQQDAGQKTGSIAEGATYDSGAFTDTEAGIVAFADPLATFTGEMDKLTKGEKMSFLDTDFFETAAGAAALKESGGDPGIAESARHRVDSVRSSFGKRSNPIGKGNIEDMTAEQIEDLWVGSPEKSQDLFNYVYGSKTQTGRDLGNTEEGDGYKYRGRGLIQVTGKGNYKRLSKIMGLDLVGDPDLILQPEVAIKAAAVWLTDPKKKKGYERIAKRYDYDLNNLDQRQANEVIINTIAGSKKDLFEESSSAPGEMKNHVTLWGLYKTHKTTFGEEEADKIFRDTYNIEFKTVKGVRKAFKIGSNKEA